MLTNYNYSQEQLGLETGDSISLILTIFSVILSIIPSIIPSKSSDSPTTNLPLFQASIDILNKSAKNNTFFAHTLLHNTLDSTMFIANDNISDYKKLNPVNATAIYNNLTNAIVVYNNELISTNNSTYKNAINDQNKTFFHNKCKNLTETDNICKELWFSIRLLDLQRDHGHNVTEDFFVCTNIIKDTHKCSYEELKSLNKINILENKGFINYFYNERSITSLEKPIESFVSGLNQFFIAILLSGPSIFLTYIKIKSKNGKESE